MAVRSIVRIYVVQAHYIHVCVFYRGGGRAVRRGAGGESEHAVYGSEDRGGEVVAFVFVFVLGLLLGLVLLLGLGFGIELVLVFGFEFEVGFEFELGSLAHTTLLHTRNTTTHNTTTTTTTYYTHAHTYTPALSTPTTLDPPSSSVKAAAIARVKAPVPHAMSNTSSPPTGNGTDESINLLLHGSNIGVSSTCR